MKDVLLPVVISIAALAISMCIILTPSKKQIAREKYKQACVDAGGVYVRNYGAEPLCMNPAFFIKAKGEK